MRWMDTDAAYYLYKAAHITAAAWNMIRSQCHAGSEAAAGGTGQAELPRQHQASTLLLLLLLLLLCIGATFAGCNTGAKLAW